MDASVTVQGEQLREAARDLRDNVVQDLLMAREKISNDASYGDYGPTLEPATQTFLDAWRAELTCVIEAAGDLASSLDAAAFYYDITDKQSADGLQSTL